MDDRCDYCGADQARYLRIIGFTTLEGRELPECKQWCGVCEPDNDRRPDAEAAMAAFYGNVVGDHVK